MKIKNKALDMAYEAKQHASNLSTELKQSQVMDKTKAKLDETIESVLKAEPSRLKFMNLFAVFSLCSLMLSSLFTFGEYWGRSFSLSSSTPVWMYIIAIIAACSYLFGAKQVISRCLILVLLLSIGFTLYDVISESYIHTSSINRNTYSLPIDKVGFGFYLFFASLLMLIVAMLKPGYQENAEFWNKIIQK